MSSTDPEERLRRIRGSALWGAYGDALGFMTELTDRSGFQRRTRTDALESTVPWRRRIGGRFGPTVELPAGCLSDDTQLRFATSRSIRGNGVFDVEAFSSIELTVWPAYALGAGRGSLAAASSLRKRDVTWATNFFETERAVYLNGGGNGAAMRIQPHVWAASSSDPAQLLGDVLTNAVCTHGHPRGLVGAAFHALAVKHAIDHGARPGAADWRAMVKALRDLPEVVATNELLSEIWLGQWELHSKTTLADGLNVALDELSDDLDLCAALAPGDPQSQFIDAVETLGAFRPEQRGSATKTSILAAVAADLYAEKPSTGILTAAAYYGTDTDTIATMLGAILGATTSDEPPGVIADRDYVLREADRMWAVSAGRRPPSFPYPSVVNWVPPKSASDVLVSDDRDALHVAGLGPVTETGEIFATSGKGSGAWQWTTLWFGQRTLVKRRQHPNPLPQSQRVEPVEAYVQQDLLERQSGPTPPSDTAAPTKREAAERRRDAPGSTPQGRSLHEITDDVIRSGLDDEAIGAGFREVVNQPFGVENAAAYAAIIAKAVLSRRDRNRERR